MVKLATITIYSSSSTGSMLLLSPPIKTHKLYKSRLIQFWWHHKLRQLFNLFYRSRKISFTRWSDWLLRKLTGLSSVRLFRIRQTRRMYRKYSLRSSTQRTPKTCNSPDDCRIWCKSRFILHVAMIFPTWLSWRHLPTNPNSYTTSSRRNRPCQSPLALHSIN